MTAAPIYAMAMAGIFRDRGGGTADLIIAEDRTAMTVPAVEAEAAAARARSHEIGIVALRSASCPACGGLRHS